MKRELMGVALCIGSQLVVSAQNADNTYAKNEETPKKWAIQAGFGQINMTADSPDGQDFYLSDDQGNLFYLSADYYLTQRWALTGQLYLEQIGMVTDLASGIGYKKINMSGIQVGAKYYFFPKKWVVQPHIGASLQTNVFNLTRQTGEGHYTLAQGWPDEKIKLNYDVTCPALSVVPHLGVDIHLFSTVSLCLDADARIGLWGHDNYTVTMMSGKMTGQKYLCENEKVRTCVSLGLKIDFPTREISHRAWNNFFDILEGWIASRAKTSR